MREHRIGATGIALALGVGVLAAAMAGPAAAQPWGRYWGGYYYYGPGYYGPGYYRPGYGYAYGPPVYEEPDEPPSGGPGAPEGAAPDRQRAPVPLARIEQQVAAAGLKLVAKPRHNGRIYLAVGEDRHGQRHRLVFDAFGGSLIENTVIRPPKPAPKTDSSVPHPLPSEATKSPLDPSRATPPAPQPAEAKAKPTDPLAIPKEAEAPKPPAPPPPAASDPK